MIRTLVRHIRLSDAAALIDANRRSGSLHRPWVSPLTDADTFERWLSADHSSTFLATEPGSAGVVGVFRLPQIAMGNFRSACLGFWAMTGFTSRGLMTDALRQVIAGAFGALRLHRIEANLQPGNHRSHGLVGRVGVRQEGFSLRYLMIDGAWRDRERRAVLLDDIAPSPPLMRGLDAGTERVQGSAAEVSLTVSTLPEREQDPMAALEALRGSIDNIDAALVHMLAERFRCTQAVGRLKAEHNMPPADPAREGRQVARLRALAREARLDPDFAEKFLAFVIREVIRHHEALADRAGQTA